MSVFRFAYILLAFLLISCGGGSEKKETTKTPDTTPPVITILGDKPTDVIQGTTYDDAGATASDNVDGDIDVSLSGSVDIETIGTYSITYTATDTSGNSTSEIRTVNVIENINEFNITLGEISIELPTFSLTIDVASTLGTINENMTFSAKVIGNSSPIESYTWSFDDSSILNGESIEKSFSVAGLYQVKLEVKDENGDREEQVVTVNIFTNDSIEVPEIAGLNFGDIDASGKIDTQDLDIISAHLLGTAIIQDSDQLFSADIDLDDKITEIDESLISQAVQFGWPTYISTNAALPSAPIMIMHPAMLEPSTTVEIQVGSEPLFSPSRMVLGYSSFNLPIDLTELQSGRFEEKNTKIHLYTNGELAHSFDFKIEKPKAITSNESILIKEVNKLDDSFVLFKENITELLVEVNAGEDEKELILHILQLAGDDIYKAQTDFLGILNAIDAESLAVIESLALSEQINESFSSQSIKSPFTMNKSRLLAKTNSLNQSLSAQCDIDSRVDRLIRTAETREATDVLFNPVASSLSASCTALSLIATLPPAAPIIPIAAACVTAAGSLETGVALLEIVGDIVPTLNSDLVIKSELDIVQIKEETDIQVNLKLKENPCGALNQTTGVVAKKVLEKILKKIRLNSALEIMNKIPDIDKSLLRSTVLKSVNFIVDKISSGITGTVGTYLKSVQTNVCDMVSAESEISMSTCALEKLELIGVTKVGFVDKELGLYTGPTFVECLENGQDRDVTIFGGFSSEVQTYTGSVDIPYDCSFITENKIDLHMDYWNTVTSVNNDAPISKEFTNNEGDTETATMSCEIDQFPVGFVEQYSERWLIDLNNNQVLLTSEYNENAIEDVIYEFQGTWDPELYTVSYTSNDPLEIVCSNDDGCEGGAFDYYSESSWVFSANLNNELSTKDQLIFEGTVHDENTTSWSLDSSKVTCERTWVVFIIATK